MRGEGWFCLHKRSSVLASIVFYFFYYWLSSLSLSWWHWIEMNFFLGCCWTINRSHSWSMINDWSHDLAFLETIILYYWHRQFCDWTMRYITEYIQRDFVKIAIWSFICKKFISSYLQFSRSRAFLWINRDIYYYCVFIEYFLHFFFCRMWYWNWIHM